MSYISDTFFPNRSDSRQVSQQTKKDLDKFVSEKINKLLKERKEVKQIGDAKEKKAYIERLTSAFTDYFFESEYKDSTTYHDFLVAKNQAQGYDVNKTLEQQYLKKLKASIEAKLKTVNLNKFMYEFSTSDYHARKGKADQTHARDLGNRLFLAVFYKSTAQIKEYIQELNPVENPFAQVEINNAFRIAVAMQDDKIRQLFQSKTDIYGSKINGKVIFFTTLIETDLDDIRLSLTPTSDMPDKDREILLALQNQFVIALLRNSPVPVTNPTTDDEIKQNEICENMRSYAKWFIKKGFLNDLEIVDEFEEKTALDYA